MFYFDEIGEDRTESESEHSSDGQEDNGSNRSLTDSISPKKTHPHFDGGGQQTTKHNHNKKKHTRRKNNNHNRKRHSKRKHISTETVIEDEGDIQVVSKDLKYFYIKVKEYNKQPNVHTTRDRRTPYYWEIIVERDSSIYELAVYREQFLTVTSSLSRLTNENLCRFFKDCLEVDMKGKDKQTNLSYEYFYTNLDISLGDALLQVEEEHRFKRPTEDTDAMVIQCKTANSYGIDHKFLFVLKRTSYTPEEASSFLPFSMDEWEQMKSSVLDMGEAIRKLRKTKKKQQDQIQRQNDMIIKQQETLNRASDTINGLRSDVQQLKATVHKLVKYTKVYQHRVNTHTPNSKSKNKHKKKKHRIRHQTTTPTPMGDTTTSFIDTTTTEDHENSDSP
mmetsp:Transcript_6726/g.9767  ORF Transcript_6726/g.9767 Transcript_6726/m.9767 type:complete len:391 (+) Transcript_6726:109-1281(+)